jgi:putative peptidoglycan lipid II flippase
MDSQVKVKESVSGEAGIIRAASIVGGATFLSRVLGFLRDMIFAKIFGATMAADAFYAAFMIPNLLRELFAEGSMSAGFIPVFVEYQTKRTDTETRAFVQSVFTFLSLLLVIILLLGIGFAPLLLSWIAPGFVQNPGQFQLATLLTRIMFPFLLFISFAALTMGILNSTNHFGPPAISSGLFNVVMILFILFPLLGMQPIISAAIGVAVGGLLQWIMQMPAVYKEGFSLSFRRPIFPLHPGLIKMFKLLLPVTLSLSVAQVNIFVSTMAASRLAEGSISFLYYGMRLIHFPLGIFGVALATALLPALSAHAARNDSAGLQRGISFGLRMIFFITVPAMIGLILLRVPIVHLLFEHGDFDRLATNGVASAVLYYSVGLWAFAGVRVVVPVFYALQDTKTPVVAAVLSMLLNILFIHLLSPLLQHGGLALATSLSSMFNFMMLIILIRKRIGPIHLKQIIVSHFYVVLSSLCLVPLLVWTASLSLWDIHGEILKKSFLMGMVILASMMIYIAIHAVLKGEEVTFLWDMIKKRRLRK